MSIVDSIRGTGFRHGPQRMMGDIATRLGWDVRVVLLSFLPPVLGGWVADAVAWALTPWQDGSIPVARWLGRR